MAYNPPKQAGIGQVIDSVIILVLLFICLLVPFLWKKQAAATAAEAPAAAAVQEAEPTWEALNQTAVQAGRLSPCLRRTTTAAAALPASPCQPFPVES